MKVLFSDCTFTQETLAYLKKEKDITVIQGKIGYTEEELIADLKEVDAYILNGDEIATAHVIANSKHLKLISFMGTGYEKYIDVAACQKYGIPVSYAPHANAKSVAEYTVALILDMVKKVTYSYLDTIEKGNWGKLQTWDLAGKTLGIVGMGAIGQHVARILHFGFGMQILYSGRHPKKELEAELGATMVSLNELFAQSDVISIHAAYHPNTLGMIGQEQFAQMQSHAIIVNTTRQELIQKEALLAALQKKQFAGIAMDGYYSEPIVNPQNEALLQLPPDRFLITPHTAYNSEDAVRAMEKMVLESLFDVLDGKKEIRNLITNG